MTEEIIGLFGLLGLGCVVVGVQYITERIKSK